MGAGVVYECDLVTDSQRIEYCRKASVKLRQSFLVPVDRADNREVYRVSRYVLAAWRFYHDSTGWQISAIGRTNGRFFPNLLVKYGGASNAAAPGLC